MKKNITINLCGRLFNIDEDAYELLRNYIDTLRNYFARQEGGNEIADDLEERIAELLDELKSQGVEAINIDHVKEVVRRVGQPEEMEGASPDTASPDTASPDPSEGRGATPLVLFSISMIFCLIVDRVLSGFPITSSLEKRITSKPFSASFSVRYSSFTNCESSR